MKALVIAISIALASSGAFAACLNPFGCAPATVQECAQNASESAKTEYAARAVISECREKFSVSDEICAKDAKAYKAEVRPSQKMAEARKITPELNGLDDEQAISFINENYYPDLDRGDLVRRLGYAPAAHRSTCKKYYDKFYK